jgi:hypothetical protein
MVISMEDDDIGWWSHMVSISTEGDEDFEERFGYGFIRTRALRGLDTTG